MLLFLCCSSNARSGSRTLMLSHQVSRKDYRLRCRKSPWHAGNVRSTLLRRGGLDFCRCYSHNAVSSPMRKRTGSRLLMWDLPSFHIDHAASLPYIMEKVRPSISTSNLQHFPSKPCGKDAKERTCIDCHDLCAMQCRLISKTAMERST